MSLDLDAIRKKIAEGDHAMLPEEVPDLRDEADELLEEVDRRLVERKELLALLQELEWAGMEGNICPKCDGARPDHAAGCRLHAFLHP